MGNLSSNITSIYNNYHPAFKNLYKIEIYPGSSEDVTEDIKTYIGLHATSITFNGETLSLERNEVTKNFQIGGNTPYNRTDELTITWREDEYWKVKRYHDDWLNCLYDRDRDCFISYPLDSNNKVKGRDVGIVSGNSYISRKNLFRKIKVKLPDHLGNKAITIEFIDILPKTSGGIDLGWGASSEIVTHSMTYYVKDWKLITEDKDK